MNVITVDVDVDFSFSVLIVHVRAQSRFVVSRQTFSSVPLRDSWDGSFSVQRCKHQTILSPCLLSSVWFESHDADVICKWFRRRFPASVRTAPLSGHRRDADSAAPVR